MVIIVLQGFTNMKFMFAWINLLAVAQGGIGVFTNYEAGSLCNGYQLFWVQWDQTHSYINSMKWIYYLQIANKRQQKPRIQYELLPQDQEGYPEQMDGVLTVNASLALQLRDPRKQPTLGFLPRCGLLDTNVKGHSVSSRDSNRAWGCSDQCHLIIRILPSQHIIQLSWELPVRKGGKWPCTLKTEGSGYLLWQRHRE